MIVFTLLATFGKALHGDSNDEVELMKRIQARDADALEEFYDLYKRLLLGAYIN